MSDHEHVYDYYRNQQKGGFWKGVAITLLSLMGISFVISGYLYWDTMQIIKEEIRVANRLADPTNRLGILAEPGTEEYNKEFTNKVKRWIELHKKDQ